MQTVPLIGETTENDHKRFWSKTKESKTKFLIEDDGNKTYCILWQAAAHGGYDKEYGTFHYDDGTRWRKVYAHRFAYYITYGIDPGPSTDHLCYNTKCVNPWHLRGCSIAENNRNRRPVLSHKCARGHEYTEDNTYITRNGCRNCKECLRLSWNKNRKAKYEREKETFTHNSEMRDFARDPKLNWNKVDEIRERYKNGESQGKLSREFQVSQPMIGHIVRNKSWKIEDHP